MGYLDFIGLLYFIIIYLKSLDYSCVLHSLLSARVIMWSGRLAGRLEFPCKSSKFILLRFGYNKVSEMHYSRLRRL